MVRATPSRDFDAMEQRRFEAARLLKQGMWPAEVARRLGVSRQSVHRWEHSLAEQGRRGLRQVGRAGRQPKLTAANLHWLKRALTAGPEAHGFAMGLWTLKRVAQLIERQFGVRYIQPRVWQILRALGWSCHRPTGQARQRDEAAVRAWKRTQWPGLKQRRGRGPHHHPRRRVGFERAPTPRADLGPAWPDPSVAAEFSLEAAVGHRRDDDLEFLLPPVSRHHQDAPDP